MSSIEQMKDAFIKNPMLKFNVSTKQRKDLMLSEHLTVIHEGNLYYIKFKNLGGGVWQMFTDRNKPSNI